MFFFLLQSTFLYTRHIFFIYKTIFIVLSTRTNYIARTFFNIKPKFFILPSRFLYKTKGGYIYMCVCRGGLVYKKAGSSIFIVLYIRQIITRTSSYVRPTIVRSPFPLFI